MVCEKGLITREFSASYLWLKLSFIVMGIQTYMLWWMYSPENRLDIGTLYTKNSRHIRFWYALTHILTFVY